MNKKIIFIFALICISIAICANFVLAASSKTSNTTNNVTSNNLTNDLIKTEISSQEQIDYLVKNLSSEGLTKENLSETIYKYKELSKNYTNDEIADMLDNAKETLKESNINTDNIDNINKVLRNFGTEQLNEIINKTDINTALSEMSSGSSLLDLVKKATGDMSTTDKASLVATVLWSSKITHAIIIAIIVLEIYKLFLRCVIYKKAQKHAWAVLIPIYRDIVMLKICKMSPWWLLLLLVPVIGWIILWLVVVASKFMLAEAFGKGEWFGLGIWLLWPIFESILVFSKKTKYIK